MIQTQVADNGMSNGMVGQAITYEKIPTQIYADSKDASRAVAQEIADLIRSKQKEGKNCILGLATGSSPKTVYAQFDFFEISAIHQKLKLCQVLSGK